jgi:hypothetical protein
METLVETTFASTPIPSLGFVPGTQICTHTRTNTNTHAHAHAHKPQQICLWHSRAHQLEHMHVHMHMHKLEHVRIHTR